MSERLSEGARLGFDGLSLEELKAFKTHLDTISRLHEQLPRLIEAITRLMKKPEFKLLIQAGKGQDNRTEEERRQEVTFIQSAQELARALTENQDFKSLAQLVDSIRFVGAEKK